MRRVLAILVSMLLPLYSSAQQEWWNSDSTSLLLLDEAGVSADRRPMDVGMRRVRLDTLALKDNIALSMADVLAYNSSIYVKQYGRGSLSTVSFRGTSASHTQVLWNGMKINSPMLGMTDFSMIPSYLVDAASIYRGGIGGVVDLSSQGDMDAGFSLKAVQGIGSYGTYDDFLRLAYSRGRWRMSTRLSFSTSRNDFTYRNYNRKEDGVHPIDTNRNGALEDLHILQELRYTMRNGDELSLDAWLLNSTRGIPMLNVDYRSVYQSRNEQSEKTLRSALGWQRSRSTYSAYARLGWTTSRQFYIYERDRGNGVPLVMTDTFSGIRTLSAQLGSAWHPGPHWRFSASVDSYHNSVRSEDRLNGTGYDHARPELSASASARWTPAGRLAMNMSVREELSGDQASPLLPSLSADYLISKKGDVRAKASVSRSHRFPTLNDLYFQPGGNPGLKPETGWSYEAGVGFSLTKGGSAGLRGEVTWFDSYVKDWILWTPTIRGFWTPQNLLDVHAYGIEADASGNVELGRNWKLSGSGAFSWTPSLNDGRQLVYVPKISSSFHASAAWKSWSLAWKWCHYSERFTTSDNYTGSSLGRVYPYFMNDLMLEKRFHPSWARISMKLAINNLFNEEYESVLCRPMPGRNYEFLIEITPIFK